MPGLTCSVFIYMKYIIGKKIGMTQMFAKDGVVTPVTLIKCEPCFVLQVKTKDKDGYEAIQVGTDKILKAKRIKKTQKGKEYRSIKEAKTTGVVGDKIEVTVFKEGDFVKVTGISKGKGFQGAVKMWGFRGKPSTHGVKHEHRTIGSIGSRWPQRVVPGKKMPGRMGGERTTTKNLLVMKAENDLLIVKGAVPGRKGTVLEIKA